MGLRGKSLRQQAVCSDHTWVAPKSSSRARPLDLIFSGSGELGPGPAGSSRRTLKLPPLRVAKADVSTMLPYDRTGHCETESHTACIGVARDFNLVEWLKDLLALAPRNARSLVFTTMTTRSAWGIKITAAVRPYYTALSTGLETARRKAVGRPEIVTSRGPENVTGSPVSAVSWQIPPMSALKPTSDRASCLVSSHAKASIDPIMSPIMSRSASIFCWCPQSSTSGQTRQHKVIVGSGARTAKSSSTRCAHRPDHRRC
jgi:hypothetical protein